MEGPGGIVLLPIAALSIMLLLAWFRWGQGLPKFKLKTLAYYLAIAAAPWALAALLGLPSPPEFKLLSYCLSASVLMVLFIGFALPPISRKLLARLPPR